MPAKAAPALDGGKAKGVEHNGAMSVMDHGILVGKGRFFLIHINQTLRLQIQFY